MKRQILVFVPKDMGEVEKAPSYDDFRLYLEALNFASF